VTPRVGVAGAGEVVSAGLKSCLTRHGVIEFVDGDPMSAEVDVVLYDVIGMCADGGHELWDIIASGIPVIALGRPLRPDLAARAVAHGAFVTLPTEAGSKEILAAIQAAVAGDPVPAALGETPCLTTALGERLTPREVDALTGVTQGFSNREICVRLNIGANTLKSVIRTAYRKIDVTTRSQAVSWCLQHGFEPVPEDPSHEIG